MEENPYSPPTSTPQDADDPRLGVFDDHGARQIVKGWEKLRVYFNLILLLPGVVILITIGGGISQFIGPALFVGIMANICFFAGPLTELYVAVITQQPHLPKLRRTLFMIGTGSSLALFIVIFLGLYDFFN